MITAPGRRRTASTRHGNAVGTSRRRNGNCPTGSKAEFPPVHDMHIGIVTLVARQPRRRRVPRHRDEPGQHGAQRARRRPRGAHQPRGRRGQPHDREHHRRRALAAELPLATFPAVAANAGKPPPPTPAVTTRSDARHATSRRSSRASTSTAAASRRRTRPGTASSSSPIRSTTINVNNNVASVSRDRRRPSCSSAPTSCGPTRSSPSSS